MVACNFQQYLISSPGESVGVEGHEGDARGGGQEHGRTKIVDVKHLDGSRAGISRAWSCYGGWSWRQGSAVAGMGQAQGGLASPRLVLTTGQWTASDWAMAGQNYYSRGGGVEGKVG